MIILLSTTVFDNLVNLAHTFIYTSSTFNKQMILTPREFSKTFEEIRKTSLTHSTCKLAIFVSCLDVDAVCSSKMLSTLLKKNFIVFQIIPVVGYTDLKLKFNKLDDGISNIILIGCGSMVDLESFLEIDLQNYLDEDFSIESAESLIKSKKFDEVKLNKRIYVIDGHRPWNLDNLFGSAVIRCLDDGTTEELEKEQKAYDFLINIDSDIEEDDDDDDENAAEFEEIDDLADTDDDAEQEEYNENSRKRNLAGSNSKKKRKTKVNENEDIIEDYYNQGTTITIPSSLQIYTFLSTVGEINIDTLWFAIVGTKSLSSNFQDVYDDVMPLLKSEVNRLQTREDEFSNRNGKDFSNTEKSNIGTSLDVNVSKKADNNSLQITTEYNLFLLHHWTLYNSFFYSNYINSKLELYTTDGKKRLKTMFARMGIPLIQANQNWHYLDIDLKKKLNSIFKKTLPEFGLNDVVNQGFKRNYGFHGTINAGDFVDSVTAILEYDIGDYFDTMVKSNKNNENINTANKDIDGNRNENENEEAADEEEQSEAVKINKLIDKRDGQFVKSFWKAFDSLTDFNSIIRGINIAKIQQQFIFERGCEIFKKQMIKNLGIYRLVVLKDEFTSNLTITDMTLSEYSKMSSTNSNSNNLNSSILPISDADAVGIKSLSSNAKMFQNPLILTKLGNWILEVCAEMEQQPLPLVIASLDNETSTYLVCGLPPKYPNMKGSGENELEKQRRKMTILNTFSLAFQEIANNTNAKARLDSFQSAIVEIRKEDLPIFLEKLSLSGLI